MTKYLILVSLFTLMTGCSLPRIIVLNDPLDAKKHNDLGVSYEYKQDYDLALREYKRAAELDESWAVPLFNLGNIYARKGDWDEAIEQYEAALKIDPESPFIMNNMAWALIQSAEFSRGISLAQAAISQDSENPIFWETLATAFQKAERPEEAHQAALRGLDLNPPPGLRQELLDKLLTPVVEKTNPVN